tara:strand:+ start:694 stop:870 length:177 start_codon:yes stop_codon:yes gene_type:complete
MKCDFCSKEANNKAMSMDTDKKMILVYTCDNPTCLEALRKPFIQPGGLGIPPREKMFP